MGGALAAAVLLALGFGLFPQGLLRGRLERMLRDSSSAGSSLGGVHVVPLLLRARVTDLRVEVPGVTLVVPSGEIQLSPRAISEGAMFLTSLALDAPRLDLAPTETPPSGSSGSSRKAIVLPAVRIDRLELKGGTVRWADPDTGTLELSPLDARGSVGVGALELATTHIRWTSPSAQAEGSATARLALTPLLDGTLEHAELVVGGSRLSARGPLLRRGGLRYALDLQGSLDLSDLGRATGDPAWSGSLSLQGQLEDTTGSLAATGHAHGNLAHGDWSAEALDARGTWSGDPRTAELRLVASILGGSLESEARLDGRRTRGQVRVDGVDLGRLPASLRGSLGEGDAGLEVRWEGPLERIQVNGTGRARLAAPAGRLRVDAEVEGSVRAVAARPTLDLAWSAHAEGEAAGGGDTPDRGPSVSLALRGNATGPVPPRVEGTLDGEASFTAGEDRFGADVAGSFSVAAPRIRGQIDARGAPGSARVEVELEGERLVDLSLQAHDLDLARLVPGAAGILEVEARASGALDNPSVRGDLSVADLAWRDVRLGPLEARVEGEARRLAVVGRLPELGVDTDSTLELDATPRLRGTTRLVNTPLSPLSPLATGSDALSGHVTATVEHDVPLDRLADADVTVGLDALEAGFDEWTARVDPVSLRLHDGRLAAEGLRVSGQGATLTATGSFPLDGSGPIDVEGTVDLDLGALPAPEGWTVGGRGRAQVRATGTRTRPEIDGFVEVSQLTASSAAVAEVTVEEARVPLTDRGLSFPDLVARVGGGRVTASGEVPWPAVVASWREGPLRPEQAAHVSLRFDDVEVEKWGGRLAGELSVDGGLAGLDEVRAALTLSPTRLRIEGVDVDVAASSVSLEAGRLTTSGVEVRSGGGRLVLEGGADLLANTVDFRGRGDLALAVLTPLLPQAALSGQATLDVTIDGSLDEPRPSGTLEVKNGSLRLRTLPQAVTALAGRVEFTRDTARVNASGRVGGGTLEVTGEALLEGGAPGDLWLQLTGREVALRYPPGLRSRFDVDLTLAGHPGDFTLAGDVAVERGVYEIEEAVGAALRTTATVPSESGMLRAVALDVRVVLMKPLLVRSSFGSLEATGQINARGDLQQPAPFGRLGLRKGGELSIQGREFKVTDGSLTFSGDWAPAVLLRGEADIPDPEAGYDYAVTVTLEGTVDEPRLTLSSDPVLSQPQIASLIATGRPNSSAVDTSAWLLGGQAATLLSGRLTKKVASSFGLDEITVRPDLVAQETDPSARFTFGKRFGPHLRVIYSAGLRGPETRFVQVEGRPGYDIALRAQRRDTGEYGVRGGQTFEWGEAEPETRRREGRVRLADVRVESDEPLSETLRDDLGLRPGRRVVDWQVQEAAENLREALRLRGYLDAGVSARLEGDVAAVTVSRGPRYRWRVEGVTGPDLEPVMRDALFEADAVDLGRQRVLDWLHEQGHLRGEVSARTVEGDGGDRWIVFQAAPGPRYESVDVRFPGASSIPRAALLDAAGGASGLLERPEAAPAAIRDAYRVRHFLEAEVSTPRIEESGTAVSITVEVTEGPRAHLAEVEFEGATLPEADLRRAARLETGTVFEDAAAEAAIVRVRGLYLSRGYNDTRIRPELQPRGGDVALVFHVKEGPSHDIAQIELHGNDRTRDSLVRRAMDLKTGVPLDPRRLAEAERRLMNLGVFSRAAVVPDPSQPSTLDVRLVEAANLSAGYDLRWDQEDGTTAAVQGEARNLLGLGLAIGGRFAYGTRQQEVRGSFFLPAALTGGDVTASFYRTSQDTETEEYVISQIEKGFQVQQSLRLPWRWMLFAGYRFRRATTLAPILPGDPIDTAGVDFSFLRNTRDDLLDPLRGSFLSVNLSLDPRWLGSDAPLVKGYAQAIFATSFADDTLTWAQSYRLGLATGFGEPILRSERFDAGGANSLRGFATNSVGPRGFLGEPAGGEAVVIVNEELRYRHRTGLGAAVFYDVGNVFERVSDVGFDLRHTLGLGLRWASPVGLLRFDVGFPLDRQEDEKSYRLFFSLGQAF